MENNILKLSKPIMVNGKEVKEIPFNFDDMTAQDKLNASKKYLRDGNIVTVQELDPSYHMYMFTEAVIKANPEMDTTDVFRINAKDAAKAEKLVRDFFFLGSEE